MLRGMLHTHRVATAFAVVMTAATAQVPTAATVVLTRTTGAFQSQVLAVDAAGAVQGFGRFPSDALPPLAVEVDPIDRQVVVAVDLGGGSSRVLRLLPGAAGSFLGEVALADLPGPCAQLTMVGDSLLAVVGGNSGGVYRLPRRGGPATLVFARPQASALLAFGQSDIVLLAWSGTAGPAPSAPGLVHVDLATGQPLFGPFPFANFAGRQITGLIDLPTALSRQLVAFADGTFALHVAGLGDPTPVPMLPPPPPGAAVAFEQDGFGFSGLGLGGAVAPYLYRADSAGTVTVLAGPLLGDPVDLSIPLSPFPQVLTFGAACGAPQLQLVNGAQGPPQVGNLSFDVRVLGAVPQQPVFLLWGFDDVLGGALPLPVLGCTLHVSPEQIDLVIANAGGLGSRHLPIPNVPSLAGAIAFAQWALPVGGGVAASAAMALHVGL